jgi:hypothetical protein
VFLPLLGNRRPGVSQAGTDILLRQLGEGREEIRPVIFFKVLENALNRNPGAANDRFADHDGRVLHNAIVIVMGFVRHRDILCEEYT